MSISSVLSGLQNTASAAASNTTSNPNTGPITFTGLGNGIDTASIISKLISLDQQPITALQNQQQALTDKQGIYSQLASQLQAFSQTLSGLSTGSTFKAVSAASSDSSASTISAAPTASAGTYNLVVTALAQAQKLSSGAQPDTTSGLGRAGVIVVNGKALSVSASDSLTTLASNINGLGAGVAASLIDGGQGNAYLTLTSTSTGLKSQIQLADFSGSVLSGLGLTNGSTSLRSPIANGAQSYSFSSGTASLQTILGSAGSGTSNIIVNGTSVSVNPSTDSLQSIANSINSAVSGVTASVLNTTLNGVTGYHLQITGASTPTFSDGGHILEALGIEQQGLSQQLVIAQDAAYSLDTVQLTSPTNSVTSAIPGVTLNLLKGTSSAPASSTLTLSNNTGGIVAALQSFVSSYNAVGSFISQNSTFNTKDFSTGPLFGDPVTQQVQNGLTNMLFQNVPGLSGAYQNLAQIGFSQDQTGNLTLDTTKLSSALAANPGDVARLFEATGQTTNAALAYVSSSTNTKPTSSSPYPVVISQAASKQSFVSGTAQTASTPYEESLSFNGALFQNNAYSLNLDIGTSLAQTVSKINTDSTLSNLVFASIKNGALAIDSKVFGASGNFSVVSNTAAAANNSGIGTGGQGTLVPGIDVAGTINGEAATGHGQFLLGNTGNTNTDGLDLQYTGATTGNIGSVNFSQGVAGSMANFIQNYSDSTTGVIAEVNTSTQSQIDNIQTQVNTLNAQLALEQQTLTQQFATMETAIQAFQSQSSSLSAITGASTSSSTSSSIGTLA